LRWDCIHENKYVLETDSAEHVHLIELWRQFEQD